MTPILHIRTTEDESALFDFGGIQLSTFLDKQEVSKPRDYLTVISSLLSMHWVFNVQFARNNSNTLTFLAGLVCKLMPFKVTPAMLKITNFIYQD